MKMQGIKILGMMFMVAGIVVSCTEEKTFTFEGYEMGTVSFSVVNPAFEVPDTAWSSYDGYGDYDSRNIMFYYSYPDDSYFYDFRVSLDHSSETWIGGYNPVTITFRPSCPEEKEAVFTMPDGQTVTLAANQSFQWEINNDSWKKMISLNDGYQPYIVEIRAKSEYRKNGANYTNNGCVRVRLNEANIFRYNTGNDKWYYYNWPENPEMEIYGGKVNFTVYNATVESNYGSHQTSMKYVDGAVSSPLFNEYGDVRYIGQGDRGDSFAFNVNSGDGNIPYQVKLRYDNTLWAGGNNVLVLEWHPDDNGITECEFIMPDGTSTTVNSKDGGLQFKYMIDTDAVRNASWYNDGQLLIKAEASESKNNVITKYVGYVLIDTYTGSPYSNDISYVNGEWVNRDWIY